MRNGRKEAVLSFLAGRGQRPSTAREIAWAVRLPYDVRGLYPLLARYSHWGLVLRSRAADGRLVYRIGERGRGRLAWLQRGRK